MPYDSHSGPKPQFALPIQELVKHDERKQMKMAAKEELISTDISAPDNNNLYSNNNVSNQENDSALRQIKKPDLLFNKLNR